MHAQNTNSLFLSFLRDSEEFIKALNRSLLTLEQKPGDRAQIETLFRNAHSLKSEADYLNQTEITAEAHRLESAIQQIRDHAKVPDRALFDSFFTSVDKIQEMLGQLRQYHSTKAELAGSPDSSSARNSASNSDTNSAGAGLLNRGSGSRGSSSTPQELQHSDLTYQQSGRETKAAPEGAIEVSTEKGQKKALEKEVEAKPLIPRLSDFEKSLLRESRIRDERFFRIYIELAEHSELPYAKAYLILSNLEQLLQVVHSEPNFGAADEMEDQDEFRRLIFFCTGSVTEKEIYRAVNIDQVQKISISPLDYKSVLGESHPQKEDSGEFSSELQVHINGRDLDELNGYVDELKIRAHRLKRELVKKAGSVKDHVSLLTRIVDDLESFTHRISLVKLDDALQPHYRLVRDLARSLDKEVALQLEHCDITLDRRAAELISEILVHLVRNAVSHGIEPPAERSSKGKAAGGKITITAAKKGDQISITISDDGAGIDEKALKRRAVDAGIDVSRILGSAVEDELLAYLVYPGLSTLPEADSRAGRGYGLDLVYQKLQEFEGGKIEVYTQQDQGTSFVMTLPSGFSILSLLVVRHENILVAVPAKYVESQEALQPESFSCGERGELQWNELPVFNPEGQLFYTGSVPTQKEGIVISYLKHRILLLVDEILFKKEVAEESITLYIAGSPHLHRMDLYNAESELFYLSPSIAVTRI